MGVKKNLVFAYFNAQLNKCFIDKIGIINSISGHLMLVWCNGWNFIISKITIPILYLSKLGKKNFPENYPLNLVKGIWFYKTSMVERVPSLFRGWLYLKKIQKGGWEWLKQNSVCVIIEANYFELQSYKSDDWISCYDVYH